jgi:Protein of unknown function (DUF2628)
MAIYTVHEPPLKKDESEPSLDRFVFVRDGFYFWAFLLTPLWMLRHRLWLVLVCYILIMSALNIILHMFNASSTVTVAASVLVALLAGFEGGTLRRFTLARRGFKPVGLVVGDDRDSAERRFFDSWMRGETLYTPSPPVAAAPVLLRASPHPEVIGLFPEPGASR